MTLSHEVIYMDSFSFGVIAFLGAIIALFGRVWLLKLAFRKGELWGIGCLLVPFVDIAFLVKFGLEALKPFLLWIVGVIIFILPIVGPAAVTTHRRADIVTCRNHCKQIALGLLLYADEYRGLYPSELNLLCPKYIEDTNILISPIDKKQDYTLLNKNLSNSRIRTKHRFILFSGPVSSDGRRNVAFADGHVEWLTEKEFKEALDYTQKTTESNESTKK